MTLTPAYGRDYKSKAEVVAAFNEDKDFIIRDVISPWCGKPANKRQLKESGVRSVNLRYAKERRVVVVNL